jgi:hypothetical protein
MATILAKGEDMQIFDNLSAEVRIVDDLVTIGRQLAYFRVLLKAGDSTYTMLEKQESKT